MAFGAQPISRAPGAIAAAIVAAVILGALLAVALRAEGAATFGPADWAAIRFTVLQALISAALSVVLAIPVARALARRNFPGRSALVALLGAPFLLPVIVAVLGLLAVFGRAGWLNGLLEFLGLPPVTIYGLHGVVLAHIFFNLPLATRLILQGWRDIPAERFRLAAHLDLGPREVFRFLERPMLARIVPGAFAVIFALCLTSFAVALILGGGPRATTVELAIYQAFRFDFDLGRAALLSCVQIVLTLSAAALSLRVSGGEAFGAGMDRAVRRWDTAGVGLKMQDAVAIFAAAAFLLVPLAAIVASGVPGLARLPASIGHSVILSLLVAAGSTALLLVLAIPMAAAIAAGGSRWIEPAGLLGLAVSPLAIGTGLFVILTRWTDPFALALPVTAAVNAIMALPFALRILVPRARQVIEAHGKLGVSLGMSGGAFLRLVLVPRMRPQIGFSAGLAAALSMGDLGVITLFADPERATLPLQIYRLMGAYRMEAAAGGALLLMILSFGLFWLCDRGGRLHAEA